MISKIDFLVLIWAFDQNLWAFYWNWQNMSRKKIFGPKTSLFNIVKFGDILLLEKIYCPILAVFRLFASLRQTPCSYARIHHLLVVNYSIIMSLLRFFNNIDTNLTNFHHFPNLSDQICVGLRLQKVKNYTISDHENCENLSESW